MSQKILLSIGTRPEIIKMAPVYHALKAQGEQVQLLHTGQHDEMATRLYDFFGMKPDYTVTIEREQQQKTCELSSLSSQLLQKISTVMLQADPSLVLVHGDTSSALTSAMAAFYQKRPVGHVEAGLRSHTMYDPFPEEMNRTLIAKLASWHFAPTARAKQNLLAEGVSEQAIHVVGNTVIDAAQLGVEKLGQYKNTWIDMLQGQLKGKKLVLVTMHRRENQGAGMAAIAQAMVELMEKHSDVVIVWPVHPNPKVKMAVHGVFDHLPAALASRAFLTEPLDYPALLWVLKHAWIVMTDSGGIQEEAVALHTPVMVLRNTTERPEVIEVGAGMLVGTKKEDILAEFAKLHSAPERHAAMRETENPFGDGKAAVKIAKLLSGTKEATQKSMSGLAAVWCLALLVFGNQAQAQSPSVVYDNKFPPSVEINLDVLDKYKQVPAQPVAQPFHSASPKPQPFKSPDAIAAESRMAPAVVASPAIAPAPHVVAAPLVQPQTVPTGTSPNIPAAGTAFAPKGFVEVGGNFSSLTNNYGNWAGEYVRGEIQATQTDRWSAELVNQHEFHDDGLYGSIGNTHDFNNDWYSVLSIGGSTDGVFLPRYRVDAFLNRKWLAQRQLVTTIGIGDYKARDAHRDLSLYLGATYYFPIPWVIQGGLRLNNSDPGSVHSASAFIAATQGRNKEHFLTFRYGYGKEAYQIIGPGQALSDFNSQTISVELRQWLGRDWGFNVRGEEYLSPNYNRTGINLGVFDEF